MTPAVVLFASISANGPRPASRCCPRPHDLPDGPFSRADLGALRAPTLLVGGGASRPPFPQILDALERGIAGAARATIPGAGYLMSREEPEAFNGAVLGFLAERG